MKEARAVYTAEQRADEATAPVGRTARKRPTVGGRIIEGLEEAIAWTRGENRNVRLTLVRGTQKR